MKFNKKGSIALTGLVVMIFIGLIAGFIYYGDEIVLEIEAKRYCNNYCHSYDTGSLHKADYDKGIYDCKCFVNGEIKTHKYHSIKEKTVIPKENNTMDENKSK